MQEFLSRRDNQITATLQRFLTYARIERSFATQSLTAYRNCLTSVARELGDPAMEMVTLEDVRTLKASYLSRGLSAATQAQRLLALRSLLLFCRDEEKREVLDPTLIRVPKRPRRDVLYLTAEEVERFIAAIPLETHRGYSRLMGVRMRALVEVLLGSAVRIGELLSAERSGLDLANRELRVIGKGNKERMAFLSERAARWLETYLSLRSDTHPSLFVTQDGERVLKRTDIWRFFARYRRLAGIEKPVRPHILRHTAATWLLFQGCPIGHIKEILGHERLETTCRYYLGLDRRAAKAAHARFSWAGCEPA